MPVARSTGTGVRHVVVVGAGVTGLLTAIECVLAGHRVTVLDRGAIPDRAAPQYRGVPAPTVHCGRLVGACARCPRPRHRWPGLVVPGADGLLTIGAESERPLAAHILSEMDSYTVEAMRSSHRATDGGFGATPLVAGRIVEGMDSCRAPG